MPVKIFFCYAHADEALLKKLKTHLSPLQREGLIDIWYDRDITAGTEWKREISERLDAAQVILLLVSPDFMDSDYCYSIEMKRALERHDRGEARVIPIILRPVYWQGALGKLQALPTDAKPVTDRDWYDKDTAFFNVVEGIRTVLEQPPSSLSSLPVAPTQNPAPRISPSLKVLPEMVSPPLLRKNPTVEQIQQAITSQTNPYAPWGKLVLSDEVNHILKIHDNHSRFEGHYEGDAYIVSHTSASSFLTDSFICLAEDDNFSDFAFQTVVTMENPYAFDRLSADLFFRVG
jgi:hypothetical protein